MKNVKLKNEWLEYPALKTKAGRQWWAALVVFGKLMNDSEEGDGGLLPYRYDDLAADLALTRRQVYNVVFHLKNEGLIDWKCVRRYEKEDGRGMANLVFMCPNMEKVRIL